MKSQKKSKIKFFAIDLTPFVKRVFLFI